MKNLVLVSVAMLVLLSACGPAAPQPSVLPVVSPKTTVTPSLPVATPIPTVPALPTDAPTAVIPDGLPAAVIAARSDLARQLNIDVSQVQVGSITEKDWPDSCLGVVRPDEACAQMITPGYDVTFLVGTTQYRYHTDARQNFRQVSGGGLASVGEKVRPVLEYTSSDCMKLTVSTQTAFWGKCNQTMVAVQGFNPSEPPLKNWLVTLRPFEAQTSAGMIRFTGLGPANGFAGTSVATPAEQRMMAEWAKLQLETAQAGRSGAAWGLGFGFHREGGIAGFCDDVAVSLDGVARVSNCKGLNSTLYLTASELKQMYTWFDGYRPIDYNHSDPATADAIKIVLNMPGQGQKSADDATVHAVVDFAYSLASRAVFLSTAGPDLNAAQTALVEYFKALNRGDFVQGARLYGGPTDLLQTWNPDIKNGLPALFERACKNNGLVCMLPRSITYRGPDSRGGYQFFVEFNNPDGSLFVQGPCCGEDQNQPGISTYVFSVDGAGDNWQIMDLPPYVP